MEKDKRKIKPIFIALICTYILIIILLCYLTINNNFNIDNEKKIEKQLNTELTAHENEYNSFVEENKALMNRIDEINNIEKNLENVKSEVFNLASNLEKEISDGNSNYKIAYLTFDDGPYYSTNKVLEILNKYKIKATFFTIGLNKDICFDNKNFSCAETYKKIVDGGHTIANHTYSHAIFYGLYNSTDSFISQVKKQEELIQNRTGVKTNILRFPGGSTTAGILKNSIIEQLRKNNYGWVDWSAQDGDGGNLTSYDAAWSNFTNSINEPIEVVLFHDYSEITISMLPQAIEYLQNNNYILLPLFYDSIKINK